MPNYLWVRVGGNVLLGGLMSFVFAHIFGVFSIAWWLSILVFAIGINLVTFDA